MADQLQGEVHIQTPKYNAEFQILILEDLLEMLLLIEAIIQEETTLVYEVIIADQIQIIQTQEEVLLEVITIQEVIHHLDRIQDLLLHLEVLDLLEVAAAQDLAQLGVVVLLEDEAAVEIKHVIY